MNMVNGESASSCELLQAQAQVYNHTFNFMNTMALKCAVQLGIADLIHNHGLPMTLSQLVTALNILPQKADSFQRLMRILVHSGFFARQNATKNEQEAEYSLTPASKLLFVKNEALRASAFVIFVADPLMTTPFHFMSSWFQNDDPTVFETAHGKTFWDCVAHDDPKLKNIFHDAMTTDSQLISSVAMKNCKAVFKGLKSLVDVGGGRGSMAEAIASAFPHIKCTVFDLPHVVANLQGSENLEFVGGDMFEAIPSADAILLKWIIHDWGDEESVKILKKCKEAIPSREKGGKVIIIDIAIDDQKEEKESTETQLCFDLLMMGLFNTAKERTVEEWKKLFTEAGFNHYSITPILGLRSLIELYP